jgi:methylamine--corrinoid protein Co-methyltransferase
LSVNGAGTVENLYEVVGHAIISAVCGYQEHGLGSTNGNMVDHHTGLEAGWQDKVGIAATRRGITREKANEITLKLLQLYKDTFNNLELGQPFHKLYNTQTITPKQEWQDCYQRAKESLTKLGLIFTAGPYD